MCEKCNGGGTTLSEALDVVHIAPCLEAQGRDCCKHEHLKSP